MYQRMEALQFWVSRSGAVLNLIPEHLHQTLSDLWHAPNHHTFGHENEKGYFMEQSPMRPSRN